MLILENILLLAVYRMVKRHTTVTKTFLRKVELQISCHEYLYMILKTYFNCSTMPQQ